MKSLVLWIIWLFILLIIAYISSQKILLTPQIGFIAGFLVQAICAIGFVDKWELDFCSLTMGALFSGTAVFLFVSIIARHIKIKRHSRYSNVSLIVNDTDIIVENNNENKIHVANWKLVIFTIFQLAVLVWQVFFIINLGGADLKAGIYSFRMGVVRREDTELPQLLNLLTTFCISSTYIWSYLFAHSIVCKYKQNKPLLLVNIILGLLCSLLFGGRGDVITFMVAFVVQAYFIHGKLKGWRFKIPRKAILLSVVAFAIVILTFQYSLRFLGRETSLTFGYYLATYSSAELKNLDIFARKGVFGADITNCYIGADIASLLGRIFNKPSWIHKFKNPYRSINGYQLGNVGTVFFAFLHDGGMIGIIFYTTIMAAICQIVYKKAKATPLSGKINLSIVTYSYLFFAILFSFFSCKFYEMFLCLHMIKIFASWIIIRFFINTVHINRKQTLPR